MKKKRWKKPELIILVKGKPEEAILAACKLQIASAGPSTEDGRCWVSGGFFCPTGCSGMARS